jgi:hypothetical protein
MTDVAGPDLAEMSLDALQMALDHRVGVEGST